MVDSSKSSKKSPKKKAPSKTEKKPASKKKTAPRKSSSNKKVKKEHTDIVSTGWVEKWIPERLRPFAYMARYDRPIGIWLLFIPCLWGLFAVPPSESVLFVDGVRSLILFALGAVVMRGAGCTINDWWDVELDQKVERTRSRPLASGDMPPWHALLFLLVQLMLGFVILLQFNGYVIALGFMALGLVFAYPLMKRFTHWPQLFLGLTMNWGVLMAWMAVLPDLALTPVFLYMAGIFWTLVYDTIYAHQDKEDDMLIGVKSTAILFGTASKKWLRVFLTGMVVCLVLAGLTRDVAALYYFLIAPLVWLMFDALDRWQPDNPQSCLDMFKQNKNYGLAIALAWLIAFVV